MVYVYDQYNCINLCKHFCIALCHNTNNNILVSCVLNISAVEYIIFLKE